MIASFKCLFLFIVMTASAFAEELSIRSVIGDQVSQFALIPQERDFLLSLSVDGVRKTEVLLEQKNHDFIVAKVNEILKMKLSKIVPCYRDASHLDYVDRNGKKHRLDFCFLGDNPQSAEMRKLTNLMIVSFY